MSTSEPKRRPGALPRPAAQRVLARLAICDRGYGTPCWLFQGARSANGYGNVGSRHDDVSYTESAHRVVYAAAFGDVPEGLQLDHLCRVRPCVNPAHLEAVTPFEHSRREQVRRTGLRESWLQASQGHIITAGHASPAASAEAMRCSGDPDVDDAMSDVNAR